MIALSFTAGVGDLIRAPLIATRDDLETPVFISLFTDARDDTRPLDDRRGWWAGPVGSLLWTLYPGKQTEETRARAEQYATEALQWLIDGGVAETVTAAAEWAALGVLALQIEITRPGGARASFAYEQNWRTQAARNGME